MGGRCFPTVASDTEIFRGFFFFSLNLSTCYSLRNILLINQVNYIFRSKLCLTNDFLYIFFLLIFFIFWLKEMNHMHHMLLRKRSYWFAAASFSFCFLPLLSVKLKAVALRCLRYYNIISAKLMDINLSDSGYRI